MIDSTLPDRATFELPLWPNGAPTSLEGTRAERWSTTPPGTAVHFRFVRNVSAPTLTAFLPDPQVATDTAVIVCPGGAHHTLAIEHEGYDVARWLAARGVAAFVLKYRVIPTPDLDDAFEKHIHELFSSHDAMRDLTRGHRPHLLADGQRALALVREHASEWGVAADRVGLMGFSAGGNVTVNVTLQPGTGPGPNFAAPIYGALWEEVTVPDDAPPLFLAYANDDDLGDAVVRPNLELYVAWRAAGLPVELHVYSRGGHGFGLRRQGLPSDTWIDHFHDWLRVQGLLERRSP
ncbi:alpha/beta hydrolase [Deinococcus sp. YIM 134068]|uniref:alpha/beta hydrolase n=1 Tax=Deinococcus lichenicola TaxID=3118910 RepID=UPI002F959B28